MANAVERLWRARESGDWSNIEAIIHRDVDIYLPAQDLRPDRDQFITMMHIMHGYGLETQLERIVVGSSLDIAAHAKVFGSDIDYHCLAIYQLQEGRVRSIEEAWVIPGGVDLDLALLRR